MINLVYLNGSYHAADSANISVLDRGFLFGDGVYEVIPVYNGMLFRLPEHLARLKASLEAIDIPNPHADNEWAGIFAQLVDNNCTRGDAVLYVQVTRGVMEKRNHAYTRDMQPSVLAMCWLHEYLTQTQDTDGIRAITQEDTRWANCYIKSINLLPNVMLKQKAIDEGATESILIRDGYAIEGSASNLFIVKQDIVRTPPRSRYMLGGITRDLVLELGAKNKIVIQEKEISEDELHDADEIWMTSSTQEIVPVTMLNQHKVGKGKAGPMWKRMIGLYQDYKQNFMRP